MFTNGITNRIVLIIINLKYFRFSIYPKSIIRKLDFIDCTSAYNAVCIYVRKQRLLTRISAVECHVLYSL